MDYLDPKKERQHRILLLVGYLCIGVAILFGTLVLVYQANGFGLKNGTVIQNGLTFFSSHPSPAKMYLNGKLNKAQTNTRLVLPAGIYNVRMTRDGYRDWQRTIEVDGGDVQHFDYPFLFPEQLTTKSVDNFEAAPGLVTQSLDKRWVLAQKPGSGNEFIVYDLKGKKPVKQPDLLTIPDNILGKGASEQWLLGEWADDNIHVLLQHVFDGKKEYILVDRGSPEKSVNLTTALAASPTKLTLSDKKFDRYYLYDATTASLQAAELNGPAPALIADHVLSYQTYGKDTVLYATDSGAPAGKVLVKLKTGDKTHDLRSLPVGGNYLLDLTKYSGVLYAAMGSDSQSKVYIYKDPLAQLAKAPGVLVPSQVLHVTQPNYLSFSASAQFIVVENGNQFGVYDIEAKKGYNYQTTQPLDAGVPHATWMDGNRLLYPSGGKLVVFDYDYTNQQTLMPMNPAYQPMFSPDFAWIYALGADPSGAPALTQTNLRTPADQ